uniref:Transformation/transcription domain-associated protein n=1 Tax=Glossina brevipalpis TaxID=37001 RepID=A0A1A9WAC6_9MUSC
MAHTESFQLNTFRSYVAVLADNKSNDEQKLRAAQDISEHFEVVVQGSSYPTFLEHSLKAFMHFLQDGEPKFMQEWHAHQARKLILEMIHRLPISENLRQHVKSIISLMLKILQIDNEENVLVCLRIIIELHKNFRPSFNPEVQKFLILVKKIYTELPNHMSKIFEPTQQLRIKDLNELNMEQLLAETYAIRSIHVENPNDTGTIQYNLLPKGMLSLRVLQELPIIVVLMYQIYKNAVHQEVSEFIPHIMETINLQPTIVQRNSQYFNKEIFIDFMGAQIKTLSFLAYIVRLFQDTIMTHSALVTSGILKLMDLCPKEAAHLRKELLIAARHIFATDLRQKFIPHIHRLFDEDLLIGKGVTLDSIRPLAYSTLADLAHHVRQSLSLDVLEKAIKLFSKNVHDETLATGIQTMSCKLLLNLVDCVRQHSEVEPIKARSLLTTLLKVFVYKFQTIANITLPTITQKFLLNISLRYRKGQTAGTNTSTATTNISGSNALDSKESIIETSSAEPTSTKTNIIGNQMLCSLNVVEYRSLVKTLVGGVKTITWGFVSSKSPMVDVVKLKQEKLFQPHEVSIYIDLVHWAMEALDIYSINTSPNNQPKTSGVIARTKEEKEVLEHFSGIFLMMHSQNFQEVFATTIDYMVERIHKNPSLQIVANSFLANPVTSPLFATVLVEYLLGKMHEMGTNVERSNLYLRLFKLVFGSVSLFPVENEQMLRPHLHNIVNQSMELALTAEEPYNYFLLLRALFRSIGGGSHDLLYQEFLPLLPNLLEGLNRLQSGFHKQHMKDLFVELCLTVPVRLSSLLPYLPMLMDPLVSALNGSNTLVSQVRIKFHIKLLYYEN